MKQSDIKILWGRSGNRCAICKLELTPDGAKETLGEMAHIIAKSPDGPRGESDLSTEERNSYDNLILLCPTHHSDIDKNNEDWSIERLQEIKRQHEDWVSKQLEVGGISVIQIDNSEFLNSRKETWTNMGVAREAIVLSITPLRVEGEVLNPLDEKVIEVLNQSRTPNDNAAGSPVNAHNTRPTVNGLANIRSPDGDRLGWGHSLEIFRSGHCEYFIEQSDSVDHVTEHANNREHDMGGADRALRYTDIADSVILGVRWLSHVWNSLLQFNDMTFTSSLVNIENTNLFSYQDQYFDEALFGFPINSPTFDYTEVINRDFNIDELIFEVLQRIVNSYGLVLEGVLLENGHLRRPTLMQ